jgi:hypothetical protein
MEYDSFVIKRVPMDVRNKDRLTFGFLRSLVRQNGLRTTQQLESHVTSEIDAYRKWLAKNKSCSTMNKLRRDAVQRMQYLIKVKDLVDAHLK